VNLYFRLLYTLIVSYFQGPATPAEPMVLRFRTWPHDLDLNFHMNNGRYLTLMDLGRVQFMIRFGLFCTIVRKRWMPVIGAVHFRFRRSLSPFQKFELHTRILSWDEKWVYFEQKFMHKNELMAVGHVKGLIRDRNGNIPTEKLLQLMGYSGAPNEPVPRTFERSA
jgi:acyl-CoA thioesterase FadM